MVLRSWFLRCTPGISTLLLLVLVEYNLQLGRSAYRYILYDQHEPDYSPSRTWQLLFSGYSIILHIFGLFFPLRLAHAARAAAQGIWTAHLEMKARRAMPKEGEKEVSQLHIRQAIILPCYKESVETIQDTLSVLASHQRALDTYDIYLAMEERDPNAKPVAAQICRDYAARFMSIQDTLHPAGIPGESAGKSSNVSWAAKEVVRKYADHPDRKDVLVTVMDSDAHLLDQYFHLLREKHCANRQTDRYVLYVPPIVFDRNSHLVPRFVRVADMMWCGAGLSCYHGPNSRSGVAIPTSVYTLTLPLVQLSNGWDAGPSAIGEDMHMMLKCYFATQGLLRMESVASPASLCNVSVARGGIWGYVDNHFARYTQGLRHMWGALDSGFAIGLWLDMARAGSRSPSPSPDRMPRSRKLSETGAQKIDPYTIQRPQRFSYRTFTVFARLFEAHFLVLHLLLTILASAAFHTLPWSDRWPYLDWTMHVTEGMRGISFASMTVYFIFIYHNYHHACTTVREWEMKEAGLYDEQNFSYRSQWSISSLIDYLTFPVAGMVFGSLPLLQAAFSHFWTERLVYLVSAKPVKLIAKKVGIINDEKEELKHTNAV